MNERTALIQEKCSYFHNCEQESAKIFNQFEAHLAELAEIERCNTLAIRDLWKKLPKEFQGKFGKVVDSHERLITIENQMDEQL